MCAASTSRSSARLRSTACTVEGHHLPPRAVGTPWRVRLRAISDKLDPSWNSRAMRRPQPFTTGQERRRGCRQRPSVSARPMVLTVGLDPRHHQPITRNLDTHLDGDAVELWVERGLVELTAIPPASLELPLQWSPLLPG